MNSSAWLFLSARLLLAVLLGAGAGALFDQVGIGVALALLVYLLLHLSDLLRVLRWLRRDEPTLAPELSGPWGDLVVMIVRLYRRKQFHKQRLLRLLRELRRSTAAMPDGVVVLNPQAEIVRYLRGGQFALPVILRSTVGVEQYLSMQIVPYGAGQLLVLVRDVTRQARLEAMRKDFVANASHELRSPLTVIAGYLETLAQDAGLDPMLAGPLHEMRRQALRMTTIITELLALSRLEAAQDEIDTTPVDVTALMAMLRKDVLARPEHPAEVRVRADADAMLTGNESEIHSAFSNLVDNAAKYTPSSGSIEIGWSVDEEGGHFSVTDTGIGIHADHIPRLTERFYRVDAGRARDTGGSGLGLAIVKHVLQRHGATLEIASVQGRGSTFTCHFPPERLRAAALLREHSATA